MFVKINYQNTHKQDFASISQNDARDDRTANLWINHGHSYFLSDRLLFVLFSPNCSPDFEHFYSNAYKLSHQENCHENNGFPGVRYVKVKPVENMAF